MAQTTKTAKRKVIKSKPQKAPKKQRWDWRKWLLVDEKEPKKLTKRGIFNMVVLLFTFGCVFGAYWEEILYIITALWTTGRLDWEPRRGLVYGPFSPVYGIGAALIYLIFYLPKLRAWVCFVGGAIFGGVLEFVLSYAQEWIFGTRSWDYSSYWLNIGGRTTIPYALVWGLLVVILARWICPFVDGVYRQFSEKQANKMFLAITLFLVFDIVMSVAAVYRQSQREEGAPAENGVEEFFDENFDDEKMEELYPSTEEVNATK